MKQSLLLVFLGIGFLFNSCSDYDSSVSPVPIVNINTYVKINKGGIWKTYTLVGGELHPNFVDPSYTTFVVLANSDDLTESFSLEMEFDGTNLATGTYNSSNPSNGIYLDYVSDLGSSNSRGYEFIDDDPSLAKSIYTINIEKITDEYLVGTFTGNHLHDEDRNGDILKITEGEFVVKRVH